MDRETYRKTELERIITDYGTGAGAGDADYNPHQYRIIPNGTNYCETLMHVLKASLGTGILAMPMAFYYAGWVSGFVFTFAISLICTYGIHILVGSQYELCKRLKVPYLTYPVAMRAALLSGPTRLSIFAYTSQVAVDCFLIIYQIGACCAYIIFVAENLKKLLDECCGVHDVEIYILFLIIPFMIIISVPDMKWLAPLSLLSNLLTFITCGILLHHIFTDMPNFSEMEKFGEVDNFPLFVGIVLFAIAAMGVITTVEKNMETPSQFYANWGVLNVSMLVITVSYVLLGFFGYWRHPKDTQASITLNLDQKQIAAKVIQGLYVVAIYISYALNGMVPVDIVWNNYISYNFKDSAHPLAWEYLVRYLIVGITFLLALTIPLLGEIISLFGAFCMAALEIIFPAIIHLCVKWTEGLGKGNWIVITDVSMMILGLVGMFSGTYSSIRDINLKLGKKARTGGYNFM